MNDRSRPYPLRQFVLYGRLVERAERRDPELVIGEYLRANPAADLDALTTFAEWQGQGSHREDVSRSARTLLS